MPPNTAQDPTEQQYDWDLDKAAYVALLRAFDGHRDVTDLAEFIGVEHIEQAEACTAWRCMRFAFGDVAA